MASRIRYIMVTSLTSARYRLYRLSRPVDHPLAYPVQRRVVERPELGRQPAYPCYATVEQIERASQQHERARGTDMIDRVEGTRHHSDHEPHGGEQVRVHTVPHQPLCEGLDHPVERRPKRLESTNRWLPPRACTGGRGGSAPDIAQCHARMIRLCPPSSIPCAIA